MRALMILLWVPVVACHGPDDPPPDDTDDPVPPSPDFCDDHPGETLCDGETAVVCADDGSIGSFEACDPVTDACVDGVCVACAPVVEVRNADPARLDEGITVEIDPAGGPVAERFARMRSLGLAGEAVVTWDGPFEVFTQDGTPVASGDEIGQTDLLVRGTAVGAGTLTFTPAATCDAEGFALAMTAVERAPIAIHVLDAFPWSERYDVFTSRDTVSARIDAERYPDRVGMEADVFVVAHREPADWAASPALEDPDAGPVRITVTEDMEPVDLWSALPSGAPLAGYDVVVDFGLDGQLDPGDLLDGLDAPGFVVGGDLSAPGPYTPVRDGRNQGMWLTMRIYYPQELDELDPMPLVVISHGNGHDYTWYDYLGNHLASHGYVVISHRNDTVPGPVSAAVTTWRNTDAFIASLPIADGGLLDGEVDTQSIAWIGHSRGGEGVVIAYDDLYEGDISPENFALEDVKLVSSIAPTVFEDPKNVVNPHDVTYHLMAGSFDGDVTGGVDYFLVEYFRIFQNATGLSATTYVQGADHNDFNCCGANDAAWASGPGEEIGRERAQQLAKSYYLALLGATFRADGDPYWEYFTRGPEVFRPDGTEVVVASQLKRPGDKLVIDDFQTNPEVGLSSSGGAVTATVRGLAEDFLDDRNNELEHDPNDPMNGMSQAEDDGPAAARGIAFGWNDGDDDLLLEFAMPAGEEDLSDDGFVSFRACQSTRHPNTLALGAMASFSVALVDGSGNESALDHRVFGGITSPFRRTGLGSGAGWSNEFQTIRIPIEAFAADGRPIDLTDVVAIRFLFGPSHGSSVGQIGFDDLEILAPTAPGVP